MPYHPRCNHRLFAPWGDMALFTEVDLSKLQAPDLIEGMDFETIFSEALVQFLRLMPEFSALTESNPIYKLLQLFTACELLIRQRANGKAQQTMPAFATGTNLDHLGELFGVASLALDPGQPGNGIAPTHESDVDFRRRIQLAHEVSVLRVPRTPTCGICLARRPGHGRRPKIQLRAHAMSYGKPDVPEPTLDASSVAPRRGLHAMHALTSCGDAATGADIGPCSYYAAGTPAHPAAR